MDAIADAVADPALKLQWEIENDCESGGYYKGLWVDDVAAEFRAVPSEMYELKRLVDLYLREDFCKHCFETTPGWYSEPPCICCDKDHCVVRKPGTRTWHLWWCRKFCDTMRT